MSRRGGGREVPEVAVLARRGRQIVAEPAFDRSLRTRVALDGRARKGADVGELVLLGAGKRGVRVVRSIGRADRTCDALEALMLDRGLRRGFATAVEDEARAAAARPAVGSDAPGRRDLRALPTFTVDPATARDFDDAISAEATADAGARVQVHIADVSAHVRPDGALERETARRATSVYVPGTVEPMLPAVLSSDACSLKPGVERLAVTIELEIVDGRVASGAFYRSLIRSDARLTYDEVDAIFAGGGELDPSLAAPLAAARSAAAELATRRSEAGALELEPAGEPRFSFDPGGRVVAVVHEHQTESHRMIEQLMIAANEQVASHLERRGAPALYRVHERPDPQAVVALVEKLASLGVPTPPLPEALSPQQAIDLIGDLSAAVASEVRRRGRGASALTALVLRSLKQAYYSPRNLGHSGLRSDCYCHFTSPIRRYPDLVCHRALLASLGHDVSPARETLGEAAEWSSAAEREAMALERAADDVCMAFLLERELGESGATNEVEFDGEVVGLVGAGAFVRFGEHGFEGFLPARRMRDWWSLNEEGTILRAEGSGASIRLADEIAVRVGRIDPLRGRVDLEPA